MDNGSQSTHSQSHIKNYPQLYHLIKCESVDKIASFFKQNHISSSSLVNPNPLELALTFAKSEVLIYLLKEGFELGHKHILIELAALGLESVVYYLLDLSREINLEETNENGSTALIEACHHGHVKVARILVSKGANVNRVDQKGMSALHWACFNGKKELVELLCSCGALVDLFDQSKSTPLMVAAYYDHYHAIAVLIKYRANVDLSDQAGRTAFDWANTSESKTLLLSHSCRPESLTNISLSHSQPPLLPSEVSISVTNDSIPISPTAARIASIGMPNPAAIPVTPYSESLATPKQHPAQTSSPMFSPFDPTSVTNRRNRFAREDSQLHTPSSSSKFLWKSHLLDTDKLQRLLVELDEDIAQKKRELHHLMTSGASSLNSSVTSTPLVPASLQSLKSRREKLHLSSLVADVVGTDEPQSPFSYFLRESKESIVTPERQFASPSATSSSQFPHSTQRRVKISETIATALIPGRSDAVDSSATPSESSLEDRALTARKDLSNSAISAVGSVSLITPSSTISVPFSASSPSSERKSPDFAASTSSKPSNILFPISPNDRSLPSGPFETDDNEASTGTRSTDKNQTVDTRHRNLSLFPPKLDATPSPGKEKTITNMAEEGEALDEESDEQCLSSINHCIETVREKLEQSQSHADSTLSSISRLDVSQPDGKRREDAARSGSVVDEAALSPLRVPPTLSTLALKLLTKTPPSSKLLRKILLPNIPSSSLDSEEEVCPDKTKVEALSKPIAVLGDGLLQMNDRWRKVCDTIEQRISSCLSKVERVEDQVCVIQSLQRRRLDESLEKVDSHASEHSFGLFSPSFDRHAGDVSSISDRHRRETETQTLTLVELKDAVITATNHDSSNLSSTSMEQQLAEYRSQSEHLQLELSQSFERYEALEMTCFELQNHLQETKEAFRYKLAAFGKLKQSNKMLFHLASLRHRRLVGAKRAKDLFQDRSRVWWLTASMIILLLLWLLLNVIVFLVIALYFPEDHRRVMVVLQRQSLALLERCLPSTQTRDQISAVLLSRLR